MRLGRKLMLAAAAMLLSGCADFPTMTDRAVAWNQTVADASNEVMLMNIVRASLREPMYFTRVNTNSALMEIDPKLGFTIPLSGADKSMDIGITATNTNTVTFDSLSDSEFINGIMTPVTPDHFRFFTAAGWGRELPSLLFVTRIELEAAVLPALHHAVDVECKLPSRGETSLCLFWNDPSENPDTHKECFRADKSAKNAIFLNNPGNPGCFQTVLRALLVLNFAVDDRSYTKKVIDGDFPDSVWKSPEFQIEAIKQNYFRYKDALLKKSTATVFQIFPAASASQAALASYDTMADAGEKTCETESKSPPQADPHTGQYDLFYRNCKFGEITLRSPEGMIYFIGQVVRQELAIGSQSSGGQMMLILPVTANGLSSFKLVPLFVVAEGNASHDNQILVLHHGKTYAIPSIGDNNEEPTHGSLDVLALIEITWGMQKKAAATPVSGPVTVIGGH